MNEQIKKDRGLLERFNSSVKNKYIFNPVELLAAQVRVERARAVKIIEKYQQRSAEEYGKISIAPLDIYMMMQSEVDGAKQEILSDNNQ